MKESVVENLKRKYKGMTARTLRTAKLIAIMTVFMSAILFSPEEAYAKTTKITMGKGQKVETGINIADSLWKSTNKKVAVVRNGKITALKNGKTTISAKYKNKSYKFQVTVSKVYLTKQNVTLNRGKSTTIRLKGISSKKVKWSTSNKSVAAVKNGKITGKKKGTATISARANGVKYTCKVKVETPKINKTKLTMTKSKSYQLKISGTDSSIRWSTSNKKTATVSSKGKLTARKKGTAAITAKVNGAKYTCKVTVEEPKLNKTEAGLKKNETVALKLNNTSRSVSWSSSNKGIATVDKKGKVKGVSNGKAVITAKISDASFKCNVTVSASGKAEPEDPAEKFSASLDKTNVSVRDSSPFIELKVNVEGVSVSECTFDWKIDDESIVTRFGISDNQATLRMEKSGATAVKVSVKNTKTNENVNLTCNVKCYEDINTSYIMDEGTNTSISDIFEGTENLPVTWKNSNSKAVSVSNNKISAIDVGSATLTANDTYRTFKVTITVKGEYLKTKGIYNEGLSTSVYEALKDGSTRTEAYFKDPEQIPFLLATADKWYKGEITRFRAEYLMENTPFNTFVDSLGHYFTVFDNGKDMCEIEINNATDTESIVNGIYSFMGGESNFWRDLLYIKVHIDSSNKKTYVYFIQ